MENNDIISCCSQKDVEIKDVVHHSECFRDEHHPAYRMVKEDFAGLIPLVEEIDRLLRSEKPRLIVALDGRCASGKTTAAELLSKIYDCNVFHMDDFFLRPEQRTEERLSRPGENVDHERFLDEILIPLADNREVVFQKYNCFKQMPDAPQKVASKRLNIVEGVYSLHPELIGYYDFTVFFDIDSDKQAERIRKRNTPEMAEKFFNIWIPLEEKYFSAMKVRSKAKYYMEN